MGTSLRAPQLEAQAAGLAGGGCQAGTASEAAEAPATETEGPPSRDIDQLGRAPEASAAGVEGQRRQHDGQAPGAAAVGAMWLQGAAGVTPVSAGAEQPGAGPAAALQAPAGDSPHTEAQPNASRQSTGAAVAQPPAAGQPEEAQRRAQAELEAEIVRQVEFYFSDANLPTDDFLIKQVRSNPEGWVPVKVVGSFNKMKKLSRKLKVVAEALRQSQQLEVSADGQRVRRRAPLPDVDLDAVRLCTVIADNLPEKPTIEMVMGMFGAAGEVAMVRIRKPDQPEPLLTKGLRSEVAFSNKTYALVEYTTPQEAQRAVETLNDTTNWRTGLRVRPLLRQAPARGKAKQQAAQHAPNSQQAQQPRRQQQQQPLTPQQQQPEVSKQGVELAVAAAPATPAASAVALAPTSAPPAAALVLPPPPLPAGKAPPPPPAGAPPLVPLPPVQPHQQQRQQDRRQQQQQQQQPAVQQLAPLPPGAAAEGWVSLGIMQQAQLALLPQQLQQQAAAAGLAPGLRPTQPHAPLLAPQGLQPLSVGEPLQRVVHPQDHVGQQPQHGQHEEYLSSLSADAVPWPAPAPKPAVLAQSAPAGGLQGSEGPAEEAAPVEVGGWKSLHILEQLAAAAPHHAQHSQQVQQEVQHLASSDERHASAPGATNAGAVGPGNPGAGAAAASHGSEPPLVVHHACEGPPPGFGNAAAVAHAGLSHALPPPPPTAAPPPPGQAKSQPPQQQQQQQAPNGQGLGGYPNPHSVLSHQQTHSLQNGSQDVRYTQHHHEERPFAPRYQQHQPHDGPHVHQQQEQQQHHHHQAIQPAGQHQHPHNHDLQQQQEQQHGKPQGGHQNKKHHEWETGRRRKDYASWASGASARAAQQAQHSTAGNGGASDASEHGSEGGSATEGVPQHPPHHQQHPHPLQQLLQQGKQHGAVLFLGGLRQPINPDGTRGFIMGRGRALQQLMPAAPGAPAVSALGMRGKAVVDTSVGEAAVETA
ncbi:hypothetical protein N2152v2_000790 [Parachlorella kessleri]